MSSAPAETAPTPVRVVLADDHALVREGIRHVLDAEPGFTVVGEASNGEEAVALAIEHTPDVVLLDISMPGENGLRAAERLRAAMPEVRILLLSMHDNVEYVREGLRIGTDGYLLKDSAGEELRAAIRAVHDGGSFFSPEVQRRLDAAAELPEEPSAHAQLALLTPREKDVLQGIVDGNTNKAIGVSLGISRRTVEAHRESLMRKLEIHNVAGLTRFALEVGVVPVD